MSRMGDRTAAAPLATDPRAGSPTPRVPGAEPLLAVAGVWFGYGHQVVLEDVSLTLERGDFLGLIGPNGSGKTTLLKIILGLLRPQRGTVRWFGGELRRPADLAGRVAYVPQLVHAFPPGFPASVAEVVATGRTAGRGLLRPLGREDWRAVHAALHAVGMAGLRDRRVAELSGGQQQRVFIARALAAEPEVLLLDEPTAGVDVEAQERFYALLGRLHAEAGLTLVLVSHDIGMITNRVTRLACLNRRLFYHGDIAGFLRDVDLRAVYGDMHFVGHDHPHEHTGAGAHGHRPADGCGPVLPRSGRLPGGAP